ncbi:MAG: DNA-directed RNA polymerase subunit P [Candidatus Diapherotrites archaeon]|uniref:DNA-directed RNA polymerase subunit Rpo12 n=1 Tax=Candidatus Iainarchaeum sp. TaxID=3101447 RepID=A0A938YYL3_9ARCH|nr:DNA-directed RNA polymerase subunit P [Candidatus Diapherotrites archaeon]
MPYKCGKCGEIIKELPEGVIRCPVCAYKVLYKVRDPIAKDVQAR